MSHGDLTFGNIIFDQNKYTFIDFEFSREGGPYIDLAHLLFNISNYEDNVGNNIERTQYFNIPNATRIIEEVLSKFLPEIKSILSEFSDISSTFDENAMILECFRTLADKYDSNTPSFALPYTTL